MILVDTSVWIGHLRSADPVLMRLLEQGRVLAHPFVVGELALGNLRHRQEFLVALGQMPMATSAHVDEVLAFIDMQRLQVLGLGYVDVHLLASVRLTTGSKLWTSDRRLKEAAGGLGVAFDPVG